MTNKDIYMSGLNNLSPLDGREILFTYELRKYLSESALHRYRAIIEIRNLTALSESGLKGLPEISEEEKMVMEVLASISFDPSAVAEYDHFGRNGIGPLEHDVKSVEVYLREQFNNVLDHLKEFIHFPMTSEDVNNLAWNLMLRDAINKVWLPKIIEVCDKLAEFAEKYSDTPVLGITHGMSASPTTFGKRFAYFLGHFTNVLAQLQKLRLSGKFSGPVGNHNAMAVAAPEFDIEAYAKLFVESFGFRYEPAENQRNSHIEIVRVLNEINLVNIFAADLCENIRHNVMMGWLYQEGKESHVGSSVMPHKINPWFFEVAQGYLEQAVIMANGAQQGLIPSVFERDLTDHPWERAYGEILGKSLVGLSYISEGLNTLRVNDTKALAELQATPEILSEAVQIVGRLAGIPNIYMTIKMFTRGRKLNLETLHQMIDEVISDESLRAKLKELKPETYLGKAPRIARGVAQRYAELKPSLQRGLLHRMTGVRAVLFDFDNTLQVGDKDELHGRLQAISENMKLGFSKDEISEFGARSDYQEMKKLMVKAYNAKNSGNPITEEMFEAENKKVSGTLDHHFRLVGGAMDLLSLLKTKGYKIGLVTTRGANSLPRLLEMHGNIEKFFDVIINRTHAERTKPHPEPIAIALAKLGVKGRNAIFVGDKQIDDVIAGRALGMQTILITEDPFDENGAIPTYHFPSMKKAINLFL